MRFILKVKDRGLSVKGPRFVYTVEDDTGKVYATRKSYRKYVACCLEDWGTGGYRCSTYFGRLDLIKRGWSRAHFNFLDRSNKSYVIVYTKEAIEKLVMEQYNTSGAQAAINEADKHATVVDKYCSGCDNYHPAFKDEEFCLICGGAHTKRKAPDLLIPLENKE